MNHRYVELVTSSNKMASVCSAATEFDHSDACSYDDNLIRVGICQAVSLNV